MSLSAPVSVTMTVTIIYQDSADGSRGHCTLSLHPFYLEDDLSFLKRIAASSADLRQSPEAL